VFHLFWLWPLWFLVPFHGVFTLIIVVVVFSAIFHRRHYYYDHPGYWRGWGSNGSRSDALDLLHARYARGEIQRDEYLQKKQDLGG
jgi:uncharacterized membrane protein